MAHSDTRNQLIALANNNAGNPTGFLEGLSDIHAEWHSPTPRTYGFLLFHHRVVRYFKAIVNPAVNPPVVAFTAAEFKAMNQAPFGGNLANVDTLGEMATASAAIEGWHGTAHMRIGMATQTPMMDPRQNIFFRPFWQLHFYIDDLFGTILRQYRNAAHPAQFLTDTAIASHIESSHHGWVSRI
jgi:hypothetical protein